ncbi:hypothetical protein AD950_08030 [Gluconobacter oxydans]|nr:hypothetical protein AD950_08030 [Gluconobacter oxydans]
MQDGTATRELKPGQTAREQLTLLNALACDLSIFTILPDSQHMRRPPTKLTAWRSQSFLPRVHIHPIPQSQQNMARTSKENGLLFVLDDVWVRAVQFCGDGGEDDFEQGGVMFLQGGVTFQG